MRPGDRAPGSARCSTPASASTIGRPRVDAANTASLLGSAASCAASSGPMVRISAGRRCGDSRSGSGITTSRPMAAGFPAAMRSNSVASSVRGHGHCPWAARLRPSTSTMTAGPDRRARGATGWQTSNHDRRSISRPGTYGGAQMPAGTTTSRKPNSRPRRRGENGPPPAWAGGAVMALELDLHSVPGRRYLDGVVLASDLLEPTRLGQHRGDLRIVVSRLVVEHAEVTGLRQLAELDANHVAGVPPVL